MRGRLLVAGALLGASLLAPVAAHASPPSDDNFANAGNHNSSPLDPNSEYYDLTEATLEPGEPLPSCNPNVDRSVWLRADATVTDDVLHPYGRAISYHADNPWPDSHAPIVAIYEGSSFSTLREVACAVPFNEGGGSISYHLATRASAWLPAHGTLYIQVSSAEPYRYRVSGGSIPAGDDRHAPVNLEPNWRLGSYGASSGGRSDDIGSATVQPDDPASSCATPQANVWYSIGPGNAATARISVADQSGIPSAYLVVRRADTNAELLCLAPEAFHTATGDVAFEFGVPYLIELGTTGPNDGSRAYEEVTIDVLS